MRPWFRKFVAFLGAVCVFYICGLIAIDLLGAVHSSRGESEFHSVEVAPFAGRIDAFERLYIPGDPNFDTTRFMKRTLGMFPEYMELANSGDDLVDQALTYLAQPGHSPLARRIAVLVVQKVPLPEWVRFANKMLDMYDNRQVDGLELVDAIMPGHFYSNYTLDEFWRPSVRQILYRLYFTQGIDDRIRPIVVCELLGVSSLLDYLLYCPRCA